MEPPRPAPAAEGYRCPECGSWEAGPDESRSRVDFTWMQCRACGEGGLVDSWQREEEWRSPFGCARCFGSDPAAAWTALRAESVGVLIHESHFGVQLMACACGQHFAVVFTERIDWHGGEDDQTWLALPIRAGEVAELTACGEAELSRLLGRFGQGRRFLLRTFPTGGDLQVWWRQNGFAIGPHD